MSETQTNPIQMLDECRDALQSVRRALIELYGIVGANPDSPQDVSRQYGLNRNLTWKLSRIINASDPFDTLNHLPGNQGMELAIRAFEKAGAPADASDPVRQALANLQELIADHAGNREHFELTLESMGIFVRDTTAESGRELAFRGNSMIWGVQVRTRWAATFLAPGIAPDTMDMVTIMGLVGFRRLRPNVQWRLQRIRLYDDKSRGPLGGIEREEFEPKPSGQVPMQIREFCSPDMPDLIIADTADGREVLLPGGPVGNRGAFDIFTGEITRGLPVHPTPENKDFSRAAAITLPAETLVFDLIAHRSLHMPRSPAVALNGFPDGHIGDPRVNAIPLPLQSDERFVELAGSPPAVSTPAIPRITKFVDRVFARMGWSAADMRGMRLQIKHPPMSSVVVTEWPLPPKL